MLQEKQRLEEEADEMMRQLTMPKQQTASELEAAAANEFTQAYQQATQNKKNKGKTPAQTRYTAQMTSQQMNPLAATHSEL